MIWNPFGRRVPLGLTVNSSELGHPCPTLPALSAPAFARVKFMELTVSPRGALLPEGGDFIPRIIRTVLFLFVGLLGSGSLSSGPATAAPLSAVREVGESVRVALSSAGDSAFHSQSSFQELDLSRITPVSDLKVIQEMFAKLRDIRAWTWEDMPTFFRRLTWLYPEDGCFLRAELMVQKLKEWGYPAPMQFFVFGDLSFSTPYETVNWWYHVAPAVRWRDQVYIIDPAVDYQQPLPVQEWIQKISGNVEFTRFAVCAAGAVSPDDSCDSAESHWDPDDRMATLQNSLANEWRQLEAVLGSPPVRVLGDFPPWNINL